MKESQKSDLKGTTAPKGETFVWFTGMGLAVGLVMVVFLFGLIAYNGIVVFWPRNVVQITLSEESGQQIAGSNVVAGIFDSRKQRTERMLESDESGSPIPLSFTEERLFVGNRDVYGQSFAFVRAENVIERSYPEDIMVAERREWGDAIFYPQQIVFGDGGTLKKGAPEFYSTLNDLVSQARSRRDEINQIDRREIGNINLEMSNIETELRYYRQQSSLSQTDEQRVESLTSRRNVLQESYQILEARADALRAMQTEQQLQYVLPNGRQGSIAIGNIYSHHFPNRLNVVQKFRVFFGQIADFIFGFPREANTEGGIYPAIFGTFVMTLIMSIAVTPFGVMAAVYLREYARQGFLVRAVRISVNNLAGVPSIVFGVFGLGFFVYLVGGSIDEIFFSRSLPSPTFGTGGILWAGLTLALLNVPIVIVATEEALAAVSRGVREGGLACGASKWQTIQNLVLPASLPGILTGLVLAMARGAGEVAPLMLVGVVALAPNLPMDGNFPFIHLERSFMHLGFHIYDVGFQSPDSEAAIPMVFATTLVLISLIVVLNMSAILLRNHIRKKYQASAF